MSRAQKVALALLVALFTAWHVPLMYRVAAGQDEDFYAVPGITILRTGLPQLPYVPSRDPTTVYYHADEILYTLPPLQFYIQSAFHAALEPGLFAARMASFAAGLVAVALVHALGRAWLGAPRGALFAAAFFLFSRAFYFPATMARPDMTAAMFGILAVWFTTRRAPRWPVIGAGVAVGLSMLSHPLGVVPAVQVGLWYLVKDGSLRARLVRAATFSLVALAIFALWAPLLLLHPDWAEIQFVRNIIMRRAGPNAEMAVRTPWALLSYQARCLVECFNPIQSAMYVLGLIWAAVRCARRAPRSGEFLFHVLASLGALIALLGRHSIRGYYVYPAAFASIAVGGLAADLARVLASRLRFGERLGGLAVAVMLAALLVPGSGLRTLIAHARHAEDRNYDVNEFVLEIIADLPPSTLVAVDQPFVLDFYLRGRPVIDALIDPYYLDIRERPFEYVVLGRHGVRRVLPLLDDVEMVKSYGDPRDEFGNYAVLYRRRPP